MIGVHRDHCLECINKYFLSWPRYGYSDVVTIPAGATNIDVKQRSHRGIVYDGIYLAIKRADGSYLLNGELLISSIEQDVHLRGTVLLYSGSNTTLERLQSFHPLPEPLTIQILRVASENVPPKIKYTFFVPKNLPYGRQKAKDKVSHHSLRPLLTAQWFLGDWSACSKSCGSGWKRRTVECRNMDGGASDQCPQELRPEDIRACGDLPCPMWRGNGWSHCSQSCGEGMKTQRISCVDYTGKETEDDKCDPKKLPAASVTPCKLEECWGPFRVDKILAATNISPIAAGRDGWLGSIGIKDFDVWSKAVLFVKL